MYVVPNAASVQRVDVCVQVCSDVDYNVGLELFRLLFKRSKQIQRIFMVNVDDFDDLAKNGRILSHAAVVKVWPTRCMHIRCKQGALTSVLAMLTARLHQPRKQTASASADNGNDRLLLYARSLGARHAFFRSRGFTPDLWFPFADGLAALVATWPLPIYHRRAIKVLSTVVSALFLRTLAEDLDGTGLLHSREYALWIQPRRSRTKLVQDRLESNYGERQ